jgi:hypothetical protein
MRLRRRDVYKISKKEIWSKLLLKHGYRETEVKEIIRSMYAYYKLKAQHSLKIFDLNE